MLEFNISFLYQLINIWVLILVLYFTLFRPIGKKLQARRDEIDGNLSAAKSRDEEVEAAVNVYQRKIQDARRAASDEIGAALRDAAETQRQKLEAARAQAAEQGDAARASIAAESADANRQIGEEGKRLSVLIAEKFLGRTVA